MAKEPCPRSKSSLWAATPRIDIVRGFGARKVRADAFVGRILRAANGQVRVIGCIPKRHLTNLVLPLCRPNDECVRGLGKPRQFNLPGFTHICGRFPDEGSFQLPSRPPRRRRHRTGCGPGLRELIKEELQAPGKCMNLFHYRVVAATSPVPWYCGQYHAVPTNSIHELIPDTMFGPLAEGTPPSAGVNGTDLQGTIAQLAAEVFLTLRSRILPNPWPSNACLQITQGGNAGA